MPACLTRGAAQSGTLTWARWCHPRAVTGGTKFRCTTCPFLKKKKKKASSGIWFPVTGSACVSPRLSGPLFKAAEFLRVPGNLCSRRQASLLGSPGISPPRARGSLEGVGVEGPLSGRAGVQAWRRCRVPGEAQERSARSAAQGSGAGVPASPPGVAEEAAPTSPPRGPRRYLLRAEVPAQAAVASGALGHGRGGSGGARFRQSFPRPDCRRAPTRRHAGPAPRPARPISRTRGPRRLALWRHLRVNEVGTRRSSASACF